MSKQRVAAGPEILKSEDAAVRGTCSRHSPYALAPLLLLVAGSGCAALIYEIVWFQLLQLVIGSSAVSLGLLLAFYMGGLCVGSAAFARLVPARLDARRVYALLEAGIGVFGILALFGVPLIGHLYLAGPANGLAGFVFRGVIAGVCLLPPTLLMGGTFPAAARWVEVRRERTGEARFLVGLLYSANTVRGGGRVCPGRILPVETSRSRGGDLRRRVDECGGGADCLLTSRESPQAGNLMPSRDRWERNQAVNRLPCAHVVRSGST